MRIGILTGGGDAPGLNAAIRGVARRAFQLGLGVSGVKNGWAGALEGDIEELTPESVRGILPLGGTILGTSRTNPMKETDGLERVVKTMGRHGIDGLAAIGGDDTLSVAVALDKAGFRVVGVPKTIDNDLASTEFCIGFDTAVQVVVEALDRLHTTASAHHRVMVVEVMGRHAGWIATYCGIAGGAHVILVPERPFDIDRVARHIRNRTAKGRFFSIVVVAEGATPIEGTLVAREGETDAFGHARLGGIGNLIAQELEKRTGHETRVTTLGHVQRGGTPTAFDRVLATRYGVAAIDSVHRGEFGVMVALHGPKIVTVPIAEATAELKTVDPNIYEVAEVFFG